MPRSEQAAPRGVPRLQRPPMLVRRGPVAENAILPATGGSIIVTPPAANTYSAWAILGTPNNPFIPSQIKISSSAAVVNLGYLLVELSLSSTGVPLMDTFRFNNVFNDPTTDSAGYIQQTANIRPVIIPAGRSVYYRVRQNFTMSVPAPWNYEIMMIGWDNAYPDFTPLPSHLLTGQGSGRYYPSNTDGGGTAPGNAAYGSWGLWKQFVAAAPNDLLITELLTHPSAGNSGVVDAVVQVGYGPGGLECPAATVIYAHVGTATIQHPVWIKAGERIALRSQGSGARVCQFKVYDL